MNLSIHVFEGAPDSDSLLRATASAAEEVPDGAIASQTPEDARIAESVAEVVLSVVVSGEAALWVVAWYRRLRRYLAPLVIVDASGETTTISVRDDVPELRGTVIVRSASGEEVRIEDPAAGSELIDNLRRALGREG